MIGSTAGMPLNFMKIIDDTTIQLDRELSDLDLFVLDFVKILEKHAFYVLISGYVAILFGRTRTTEDVDLFIERISEEKAKVLYNHLIKHGFWALNASSGKDLFEAIVKEKIAVRFAYQGKSIPNIELKCVKDLLDAVALQDRIKVKTLGGDLWISNIPLQVAYKRFVLGSKKDLEDAQHLQKLFKVPEEEINQQRRILHQHGRC